MLKETSHKVKFAWKWYSIVQMPWLGHDKLDFKYKKIFLNRVFEVLVQSTLIGPLKFLCNLHLTLTNPLFLGKTASVDTSRLLISTFLFAIVIRAPLDVTGGWVEQLFIL